MRCSRNKYVTPENWNVTKQVFHQTQCIMFVWIHFVTNIGRSTIVFVFQSPIIYRLDKHIFSERLKMFECLVALALSYANRMRCILIRGRMSRTLIKFFIKPCWPFFQSSFLNPKFARIIIERIYDHLFMIALVETVQNSLIGMDIL